MQNNKLKDLRCPECNKLIARADITQGIIEYLCGRCKKLSTFTFQEINDLKQKNVIIKMERSPAKAPTKV